MSPPLIPIPLQNLSGRPFSFYPAIVGIEHNEWLFRRATWSEILVANTRTGGEISIPRRFVGEMSSIEDPVLILGLIKELEYRRGAVWPHQRRVIEMPLAVGEGPRVSPPAASGPAPVIGIRLESSSDSRMGRLIGATLLAGIVTCIVVVNAYREGFLHSRVSYTARNHLRLPLNPGDDYNAVVRKLGQPAEDRWIADTGAMRYRALLYPGRSCTVVLAGSSRETARYAGAVEGRLTADAIRRLSKF